MELSALGIQIGLRFKTIDGRVCTIVSRRPRAKKYIWQLKDENGGNLKASTEQIERYTSDWRLVEIEPQPAPPQLTPAQIRDGKRCVQSLLRKLNAYYGYPAILRFSGHLKGGEMRFTRVSPPQHAGRSAIIIITIGTGKHSAIHKWSMSGYTDYKSIHNKVVTGTPIGLDAWRYLLIHEYAHILQVSRYGLSRNNRGRNVHGDDFVTCMIELRKLFLKGEYK